MLFNMGPQELVIIGVLAILLYGKRLPEVAKSLGGTYREFRKGLADMQAQLRLDDSVTPTHNPSSYQDDFDDYDEPSAPKFEPPTEAPTADD